MRNKFCNLNENKPHIEKLLRFMVDEVCSAGGDGDAFWYSECYDIKDIYHFINEELAPKLKIESKYFNWELKLTEDSISWGEYQEWLTITNNIHHYITIPEWSQFTLKY